MRQGKTQSLHATELLTQVHLTPHALHGKWALISGSPLPPGVQMFWGVSSLLIFAILETLG